MKNKIAILTQPLGTNYGGIIQNYALHEILKKNGYDPTTVNRVYKKAGTLATLKTSIRHLLKRPNSIPHTDKVKKKVFFNNYRFIKDHIQISKELDSDEELKSYFQGQKFDVLLVGSDQVWRPMYSPNIFSYYFDFANSDKEIKKLSYAASFGTEDWEYTEEQTQKCRGLIQKFDAVSVREDSGIKLCSEHLNRQDVVHVLDPTLLLNAEDYSQLIGKVEKKSGLFSYVLDDAVEKNEFIKNCASILNLKVFNNQSKYKFSTSKSNKLEDHVAPPLEGWLQGFRDADFVITDSFHGTIFSIINQRPFIILVNEKRGASRFESFLQQLDLTHRLVYDINDFDTSILETPINYDRVNEKLDVLKKESLGFLLNSL